MAVCTFHPTKGQSNSVVKGREDICMFDLIDAVTETDAKGNVHPRVGESVTISISFEKSAHRNPIMISLQPINAGTNSTYIRLSYLSVEDINYPTCLSTIIAYDHHDATNDLADYSKVKDAMLAELEQNMKQRKPFSLTDDSYVVYKGSMEFAPAGEYNDLADTFMTASRYLDALRNYNRAYSVYKQDMELLSSGEKKALAEQCLSTGTACYALEDTEQSLYFSCLQKTLNGAQYDPAGMLELLASCADEADYVSMGFVLNKVLDLKKDNVSEMMVLKQQGDRYEPSYCTDPNKIWVTDMQTLIADSVIAIIRFNTASANNLGEGFSNTAILQIFRNQTGGFTGGLIVPPFVDDSDKLVRSDYNDPFHRVLDLSNDGSIYNLHQSLSALKQAVLKGADEKSTTVINLCTQIGGDYIEIQDNRKAIPFLDLAKESLSDEVISEYVNALANESDPRSYQVINTYLSLLEKQDPKLETFRDLYQLLLRRQGYVLIEMDKLDAAEEAFKKLLKYPESKSYAEGELQYIKQVRAQGRN